MIYVQSAEYAFSLLTVEVYGAIFSLQQNKQQKQWQGGIIIPSFLKRAAGAGRAVKAVWWSSPRAADPTEIFFLSRLWRSSRRYNGKQNRKQFPFCTESAFKANSGGTAFNTRPDTFSGRVFLLEKAGFSIKINIAMKSTKTKHCFFVNKIYGIK